VARQRALSFDLVSCKQGMLDASKGREKLLLEKNAVDAERADLVKQIESERAGVSALHEALEKERVVSMLKEEEMDKVAGTYHALSDSLEPEIKSGQIEVTQDRDRIKLRAADATFFDSGKSELKADGKKILAKVAASVKDRPDSAIRVEGHTDNVPIKSGRFPSNWDLSVARAMTVAKFLSSAGVSADRLGAAGYGEHRPIASNADAQGRAKNRRIEIVLEPLVPE
jgi:chemotaxis protein MotB